MEGLNPDRFDVITKWPFPDGEPYGWMDRTPHGEYVTFEAFTELRAAYEAELARRKFMQVTGNFLGWGFESTAVMEAEGAAAAGVSCYVEVAPYRQERVFVRYAECGGDREAAERLVIDRARERFGVETAL